MTTHQLEVASPPVRNWFYDLPDDLRRTIELRVELYNHADEIRAQASGWLKSTEQAWMVRNSADDLGKSPFVYTAERYMQTLYPQQYEEMWPADEWTPRHQQERWGPRWGDPCLPWGRSRLYGLRIDALDLDWGGAKDGAEFRTRRFLDWTLRGRFGIGADVRDFLANHGPDYLASVVLEVMRDYYQDQDCGFWDEDGTFCYDDMAYVERAIMDTLYRSYMAIFDER